ncbi:hypothetical protein IV460_15295 [Enterococcus casseliflavus]|uniref:hypothetical protein n=1 Tax=Enterococcus casseliflavus TaxID=37734 RepID=UPI001E4F845E|nr:hypothetical protein [Enterococcus casseliflavus]MCD5192403.1 hypothetical protein [Enterococcus casseliflavus]
MVLPKKSNHVREVKMMEVIHVVSFEGEGTEENPARLINEYYSKEGTLLATKDEWLEREIEKAQK